MDKNLLPAIVIDLVDKFQSNAVSVNEKFNIQVRLETIFEYVSDALEKYDISKEVFRKK